MAARRERAAAEAAAAEAATAEAAAAEAAAPVRRGRARSCARSPTAAPSWGFPMSSAKTAAPPARPVVACVQETEAAGGKSWSAPLAWPGRPTRAERARPAAQPAPRAHRIMAVRAARDPMNAATAPLRGRSASTRVVARAPRISRVRRNCRVALPVRAPASKGRARATRI
jgi:hypothetical protein